MSTEILLPRLSDTMEEGVIDRWLCATGDTVTVGQEIAEGDTDKATVTLEAEAEGVLQRLVEEGATVPVGAPIGRIGTAEEAAAGHPPPGSSTTAQSAVAEENPAAEEAARQTGAAVAAPIPVTPAGTTDVGRAGTGEGAGHIHAAFAEQDGTVVGGHVFRARVLGTVEMTLLAAPSLGGVAHPVLHQAICSTTHILSPAASGEVMLRLAPGGEANSWMR